MSPTPTITRIAIPCPVCGQELATRRGAEVLVYGRNHLVSARVRTGTVDLYCNRQADDDAFPCCGHLRMHVG